MLRRLSALLLCVLFLQLTLLGDGAACRTHGPAGTRAKMPMASAQHDGAPGSHDGCGAERATKACATMPACATVFAPPVTFVAFIQNVSASQTLPAPVSIHSQPAAGPDVPPPRG